MNEWQSKTKDKNTTFQHVTLFDLCTDAISRIEQFPRFSAATMIVRPYLTLPSEAGYFVEGVLDDVRRQTAGPTGRALVERPPDARSDDHFLSRAAVALACARNKSSSK